MAKAGDIKGVRWWPFAVIIALVLAAWLYLWFLVDLDRYIVWWSSAGVGLAGMFLLFIWAMFFSRFSLKLKLILLADALGTLILFALLFRVTGFDGDMVPQIQPRWVNAGQTEEVVKADGRTLKPDSEFGDYPRYLGPNGNATFPALKLKRDWDVDPPKVVWRRPVGEAWSGFTVMSGLAVTQEQIGGEESVTCYRLTTGEPVWRHGDELYFTSSLGGNGPRATPWIDEDRVYTVGATGILSCLDLQTGKVYWRREVLKEHGAVNVEWGNSRSPVVYGDLVIVSVGAGSGRSLVGYDKRNGDLVWSGGNDPASYSSPNLVNFYGREQVVILNQNSVASHNPSDGELLWRLDWQVDTPNVSQPLVLPGERLFVSAGYGVGSKLYQIEFNENEAAFSTRLLWENNGLKAKFTNVVFHDGFLYGLDEGILVCLDPVTGERKWKNGRYGHGQVLLLDDLLLIQSEHGALALVEAKPESYQEIGRIEVFDHKTWNPPALAAPFLLLRTHKEAVCLSLEMIQESVMAVDE